MLKLNMIVKIILVIKALCTIVTQVFMFLGFNLYSSMILFDMIIQIVLLTCDQFATQKEHINNMYMKVSNIHVIHASTLQLRKEI